MHPASYASSMGRGAQRSPHGVTKHTSISVSREHGTTCGQRQRRPRVHALRRAKSQQNSPACRWLPQRHHIKSLGGLPPSEGLRSNPITSRPKSGHRARSRSSKALLAHGLCCQVNTHTHDEGA